MNLEPDSPVVRHPGRRAEDPGGGELTFPIAISRIAVWALLTILGLSGALQMYLAQASSEHTTTLARMEERSRIYVEQNLEQSKLFHQELERLTLNDTIITSDVRDLQIQAAAHGWGVTVTKRTKEVGGHK